MAQPVALLISADPDRRSTLRDMLQQSGYLALVAGGAATARLWLRRVTVDLVVSEADLPDARVESILRALSSTSRSCAVPTIVLGALTASELRAAAGHAMVQVRPADTDLASIAVLADAARRGSPAARGRQAHPVM